jgi:hypothetical protein
MFISLAVVVLVSFVTSKSFLNVPLHVIDSKQQPIFPVEVGTRFMLSGVYKTPSDENNQAQFSISDGKGNLTLLLEMRFNYRKYDNYVGSFNYFIISSKYHGIWAIKTQPRLEKRYKFPMDLEDGLEIEVIAEVTESHYEVTINGVKMAESMINNREHVEYHRSKTAMVKNCPNFTFNKAVYKINRGKRAF